MSIATTLPLSLSKASFIRQSQSASGKAFHPSWTVTAEILGSPKDICNKGSETKGSACITSCSLGWTSIRTCFIISAAILYSLSLGNEQGPSTNKN